MYGLLLVAVAGFFALWRTQPVASGASQLPMRLSGKLDRLWEVAQESLHTHKYLRAEKALLTILRIDERNATAYNRLGILYAKQKAFDDAIECFEIAQSLEPSASSLHNVGLIYFETKRYDKAALAFEQALAMEDKLAARHIAYAKVQEKLGNTKKMLESYEKAAKLEPSDQMYQLLADAYDKAGNSKKATQARAKISHQVKKQPKQPARITASQASSTAQQKSGRSGRRELPSRGRALPQHSNVVAQSQQSPTVSSLRVELQQHHEQPAGVPRPTGQSHRVTYNTYGVDTQPAHPVERAYTHDHGSVPRQPLYQPQPEPSRQPHTRDSHGSTYVYPQERSQPVLRTVTPARSRQRPTGQRRVV